MELYFNPYPDAAENIEAGIKSITSVADAFVRLRNDLPKDSLAGYSVDSTSLRDFILFREAQVPFGLQNIIHKIEKTERDKIILLLSLFSRGKVIDLNDMEDIESWIFKGTDLVVPILEFAAKKKAVALTIPTEFKWCVDPIEFEGREEILHNLWGQKDLSSLKDHYINNLKSIRDRFSIRYDAKFCDGALNSAPEDRLWERFEFFQQMDKAKMREYEIDDNVLKNVGNTKYGILRELRCRGEEWRVFFVYRSNASPKVLLGGFYQKSSKKPQNEVIQEICERINATDIRDGQRR